MTGLLCLYALLGLAAFMFLLGGFVDLGVLAGVVSCRKLFWVPLRCCGLFYVFCCWLVCLVSSLL